MTRREYFRAYLMKSKVVAAVTGIMGLIAAQFVCHPSVAQLKPWGHSNDVLVDLSVVGNSGTGHNIETGSRLSIPILGERLLEPPRRMPVSRLLSPGTPMKRARLENEALTIKLVPPSKLRKRSAVKKRKPKIKAPRKVARKLNTQSHSLGPGIKKNGKKYHGAGATGETKAEGNHGQPTTDGIFTAAGSAVISKGCAA